MCIRDRENNSVTFSRISPDGENGFPGEFDISVTYEFTEKNAVRIVYTGVCDKTTIANMTNHSYFNLAGEDVYKRQLQEKVFMFRWKIIAAIASAAGQTR